MTDKFIQNMKSVISAYRLIQQGDIIIVGVSGGADSMALLHALHKLQHILGVRILAGHYNHNLRKDSLKDQKFVEDECARIGIPCFCGQWKNPKVLRQSVEDAAREKRLSFLINLANKKKAARVALAHNFNDQAETILMRILRGTGLKGFRGILPKTEFRGVTLIRPLLQTNRNEITAYLNRSKTPYQTDPTNKQNIFFRNRIRNQLLPYLRKNYSPNIEEILSNLAENISVDYEFLDQHGRKQFNKLAEITLRNSRVSYQIHKLKKQPQAVRRIMFRAGIEELKENTKGITLKHIKEIEKLLSNDASQPLGPVHLTGNIKVFKKNLNLIMEITK